MHSLADALVVAREMRANRTPIPPAQPAYPGTKGDPDRTQRAWWAGFNTCLALFEAANSQP